MTLHLCRSPKPSGKPPRSLLSFEDELEGEEFVKVKKTSHSRRMAKMLEREKRREERAREKDSISRSVIL